MDTTLTSTPSTSRRGMHVALWIAQVVLALAFFAACYPKLTAPADMLAASPTGVLLTRFIGVCEFLGALGLLLPAATRIKPILTPYAAIGLCAIMVLATGFHAVRGEFSAMPTTIILGLVAAFIAWGRLKKAPIAPRPEHGGPRTGARLG